MAEMNGKNRIPYADLSEGQKAHVDDLFPHPSEFKEVAADTFMWQQGNSFIEIRRSVDIWIGHSLIDSGSETVRRYKHGASFNDVYKECFYANRWAQPLSNLLINNPSSPSEPFETFQDMMDSLKNDREEHLPSLAPQTSRVEQFDMRTRIQQTKGAR